MRLMHVAAFAACKCCYCDAMQGSGIASCSPAVQLWCCAILSNGRHVAPLIIAFCPAAGRARCCPSVERHLRAWQPRQLSRRRPKLRGRRHWLAPPPPPLPQTHLPRSAPPPPPPVRQHTQAYFPRPSGARIRRPTRRALPALWSTQMTVLWSLPPAAPCYLLPPPRLLHRRWSPSPRQTSRPRMLL